jgi:hypothetical protein
VCVCVCCTQETYIIKYYLSTLNIHKHIILTLLPNATTK